MYSLRRNTSKQCTWHVVRGCQFSKFYLSSLSLSPGSWNSYFLLFFFSSFYGCPMAYGAPPPQCRLQLQQPRVGDRTFVPVLPRHHQYCCAMGRGGTPRLLEFLFVLWHKPPNWYPCLQSFCPPWFGQNEF